MPPPPSVTFEDKEIPLWTYGQLEQLDRKKLKNRAQDLQNSVGPGRVPAAPVGGGDEATIKWIIGVQCALLHDEFSSRDFGLPVEAGQPEQQYFGASDAPAGARAQQAPQSEYNPNTEMMNSHAEAIQGREAAKARNRGNGIF